MNKKRMLLIMVIFFLYILPCKSFGETANNYLTDFCKRRNMPNEKCNINKYEEVKIKECNDFVQRKGPALKFRLNNSQTINIKNVMLLEDQSNSSAMVEHYFIGYNKIIDYYIMANCYYEGGDFTLISRKNGKKYDIQDYPNFSPDNRRIVTIDMYDAYSNNELQILNISDNGLTKEFSLKPDEYWASGDVEWIDKDRIRVKKEVAENQTTRNPKYVFEYFYLVKTQKGWAIDKAR
jgi:hypothetical protein